MTTRIVVLGAGYSGQPAARLLARARDVAVTIVNERDQFVERVRLHQLAAGERLRERPLTELMADTGVEVVIDRVTAIDPDAKSVVLAGGSTLPYDTLVYALGSRMDVAAVPGVAEHAYSVAIAEEAARLRARVPSGGVVTVVGGGLTGIEAATELAEQHPELKVRLVTGDVLGERLSEKGRRHLRRTFARLGIEVRERAAVAEVRADGVVLAGAPLSRCVYGGSASHTP
jgi:NADH dehydrogenase FAD-containing subunit